MSVSRQSLTPCFCAIGTNCFNPFIAVSSSDPAAEPICKTATLKPRDSIAANNLQ